MNINKEKNLFSPKNTKNKYISYLILTIIVIFTRLPFYTKYLFEYDSIQLALGIEKFNILQHHPHPPGYFFYIYLGKAINHIIDNPNYSLIIINIFFTIIASILFYKIALKIFKNKNLSLVSSIIFISNPFIWFHGEFANVYMADVLFSLIYFYLSYLIINEKKDIFALFTILFGLGIGFRQSILIFFLPLYIYTFIIYLQREKDYFYNIILNIILLSFINLTWLIPSSTLSGGFYKYLEITKNQYLGATSATIFSLSRINKIYQQIFNVIKLLFYSGGLLSIFIILSLFKKRIKIHKKVKKIFSFWFWPSFLFYSFIHLGKIGYILSIVPLILILGITAIYETKSIKHKYLIISLIILFQTFSFTFNTEKLIKNKKILINVSPYTVNALNLKNNDYRLKQIIETVKKYDPQTTIIITEGDSPYLKSRTNYIKNARHLNYYLPEYYIYHIFNDQSQQIKYYRYYQKDMRLLYQSYIPIDKNIENILVITDDYNYDKYKFQYANYYIEEKIFYKDISQEDNFRYLGYDFAKQY